MKMINRFIRHVNESIAGITRHKAMSLSSIVAVTLTLMLISLFLVITANFQQITSNVEGSLMIHVKIENTVIETAKFDVIEEEIMKIEGVKSITFSSKDEELQKQIEAYPEQAEVYKMYEGENNPLRNAYYVETDEGADIKPVSFAIEEIEGIEKASYGGDGTETLINALDSFQNGGLILVSFLCVMAIFLISNTIKVTINSRQEEIQIMKVVGATNGFIRAPFLLEGAMIGLFGSVLPIVLTYLGYNYIYTELKGRLFTDMFPLLPEMPFILYLSAILGVVGIVVGSIGSFIAVTRQLWLKK